MKTCVCVCVGGWWNNASLKQGINRRENAGGRSATGRKLAFPESWRGMKRQREL